MIKNINSCQQNGTETIIIKKRKLKPFREGKIKRGKKSKREKREKEKEKIEINRRKKRFQMVYLFYFSIIFCLFLLLIFLYISIIILHDVTIRVTVYVRTHENLCLKSLMVFFDL